jgi:hypothetical protein
MRKRCSFIEDKSVVWDVLCLNECCNGGLQEVVNQAAILRAEASNCDSVNYVMMHEVLLLG